MRIQVQIQETLIRQYSHHSSVKNAISQLDSELMDITKVTKTGHESQRVTLLCISIEQVTLSQRGDVLGNDVV